MLQNNRMIVPNEWSYYIVIKEYVGRYPFIIFEEVTVNAAKTSLIFTHVRQENLKPLYHLVNRRKLPEVSIAVFPPVT